jgi:hypothetical protein
MDIILFFVGIFALLLKRRDWALAIMAILASTYLQLPLQPHFSIGRFPIEHNISDIGLLLYLFILIPALFHKKARYKGKIQNVVTLFLIYLIVNGIWDMCTGTSFGDVIRYLKGWAYLSLIYIYQDFSPKEIVGSLRIVCVVTFWISLVMVISRVLDINAMDYVLMAKGGRGYKPPSFSIICSLIYIINIFRVKPLAQFTYVIVTLLPILLNVKMTYLLSVVLVVVVFFLINDKFSMFKKIALALVSVLIVVSFFTLSERFSTRFYDLSSGLTSAAQGYVDDNFSYRLLHAAERFNYVSKAPDTFLRGIGYVSEANFNDTVFQLGVWNSSMKRVDQLNNSDIVWSNMFLRLGIIGIVLYLLVYIRLISAYMKCKTKFQHNAFFAAYLIISLLFTSLGNDLIGYSDFFMYPILFLNNKLLFEN